MTFQLQLSSDQSQKGFLLLQENVEREAKSVELVVTISGATFKCLEALHGSSYGQFNLNLSYTQPSQLQ